MALVWLAGCGGGGDSGQDGGSPHDASAPVTICQAGLGAPCASRQVCCNGLHCQGDVCAYQAGDTCLGDKYDSTGYPGGIACCNLTGGLANTGRVATQCYANWNAQSTCSTDADCVLGDACQAGKCKPVCSVGGYPFMLPCCNGQLGSGFDNLCGYKPGDPSNSTSLCFSGMLEVSATSAVCK